MFRFQYYSLFLMFGIPLMVVFGITNLFQGSYWVSILATISACGLASGWLLIKYKGKGIVIYRINAVLYLLLLIYLLSYGGEGGSKVLWIYTFPLVCFFLFGKREGTIWSSFTITTMFILLFSPASLTKTYAYHFEFKIRLIASYITVTGIAFWLEHLRHFYSTSLQTKNRILNEEINERKRIEKQREQLMLEVQSANQAKSDFLANMSHEIRTPLNGIIGMTSMLMDTHLTKHQQHYANTLQTSGNFLLTIINDILDVSKIEAGKFELHTRPFNLRELLDRFVDIITRKIYNKNVELVVWADTAIPTHIVGDADRLQQILLNLTSNALKFTPEGSVTVKVRLHEENSTNTTLHFSVKDTGVGISKENQNKLFQSFSQIDTSTTREHDGTGLGLHISKQLSELMDGEIGVSSSLGVGSEFWFLARFMTCAQQSGESGSPLLLSEKSVVLTTKSSHLIEMLSQHLRHWGAVIDTTESPGSLLEKLGNPLSIPDLIFLDQADIAEPIDSYIDKLIEVIPGAGVQIIFLEDNDSADNTYELPSQVDILSKPVKYYDLLRACGGGKNIHSPKEPLYGFNNKATGSQQSHWKNCTLLLAEDNPINREVLLGLLEKIGIGNIDTVDNGIDVLKALEEKAYDLILMDVSMPKMDGLTVTEKIRHSTFPANSSQLPIVALTAHAIAGDRERCLKAGMNDYLTKPVNPRDLQQKLEMWMQAPQNKGDTTVDSTPAQLQLEKFVAIPQFDYSALLERMLGDEQLVQGVLELFLTEVPEQLEHLENSIRHDDVKEAGQLAHKLAGGLANLSIHRMHAMAKEIQHLCETNNPEMLSDFIVHLNTEFHEVQHLIRVKF